MIVFIQDLDNLRERIKGIDYSIMALIAQRVNLALQIGKLKHDQNLPIRNFQVEKLVFDRIERYSDEFQLNFEFIKEVYKHIISQSVSAQLIDKYNMNKPLITQKVLVIGGAGKMGKWFVRYLRSSGFEVGIVDPNVESLDDGSTEIPELIEEYDYIIVAVPLKAMREVLTALIEMKPNGVIFEISSLKSHIIDILLQAESDGIKIVSIHPMFGPDVNDLTDRNLIICQTKVGKDWKTQEINNLFEDTAVQLHSVGIEEHDKKMLYSLGLSHFINILNGSILSNASIPYIELEKFAGTTFTNQVQTTLEVYQENPQLYFSIQQINAYQDILYSEILKRTNELIEIISDNDEGKFLEIMQTGINYLRGDD